MVVTGRPYVPGKDICLHRKECAALLPNRVRGGAYPPGFGTWGQEWGQRKGQHFRSMICGRQVTLVRREGICILVSEALLHKAVARVTCTWGHCQGLLRAAGG